MINSFAITADFLTESVKWLSDMKLRGTDPSFRKQTRHRVQLFYVARQDADIARTDIIGSQS